MQVSDRWLLWKYESMTYPHHDTFDCIIPGLTWPEGAMGAEIDIYLRFDYIDKATRFSN